MIQLHNLSLTETNHSAAGSSNSSNNPSNLATFETALSDAIAATFKQFGIDPNSVNISITPESAGSSSATATPSTPAGTGSPATPSSVPYDPFLQAASGKPTTDASTSPATASSGAKSNDTTASTTDPIQAFDDAYWAQQPAAVQALRSMQPEQRAAAARNLASEGYTIDVPIMVWGWDPQIATQIRQAAGYTWVPSALQNPIESMPGIAPLSGLTAYNPSKPPAGSILV